MPFSYTIRLVLILLAMSLIAVAQNENPPQQSSDTSAQQPGDTGSEQRTVPSPAFGQTAPILNPENPPISGIDEPRIDLRRALRSFISGGVVGSTSADTNPSNQLGRVSAVKSVSHVLGALDLQRFWPKSDLFAEYMAGGSFYASGVDDVRQLQAVGLLGATRWRTGQISLHEMFNYLPEGSFGGGGSGGTPGLGLAQAGSIGIPGGNIPGSNSFTPAGAGVGLIPRITDITLVEIAQSLTPRSAVTLVGGYSMAHYLEHQDVLFNSQQFSAEGGYSYLLNRRDQVGIVYAFREFRFPQSAAGKIDSNMLFLRWGRTISGRMSLVLGAGPQYVSVYEPTTYIGGLTISSAVTKSWSGAGRAALHYQFARSGITLSYEKFTSAGSGFTPGSDTQVARFTFTRPLSRTLDFTADLGYSHNKRLESRDLGLGGSHFNSGFAGAVLRKRIGRNFGVFASYHFNESAFDIAVCQNGFGCGRISRRHAGTLGLDWHFRPIRIE